MRDYDYYGMDEWELEERDRRRAMSLARTEDEYLEAARGILEPADLLSRQPRPAAPAKTAQELAAEGWHRWRCPSCGQLYFTQKQECALCDSRREG